MSKVVLFGTSSCSWCRRAKRYFEETIVERGEGAARDIVRKTGRTGVPVVGVGGAWIVGFEKARIERELGRRAS